MDEILASIRRIIESGDDRPVRRPASVGRADPIHTDDPAVPAQSDDGDKPSAAERLGQSGRPLPAFGVHYLPQTPHEPAEIVTANWAEPARARFDNSASEPEPVFADDRGHSDFASDHGHDQDRDDDAERPEQWGDLRPSADLLDSRDTASSLAIAVDEETCEPAGMPAPGNENLLGANRAGLPEFSFEFNDEAFEAELRGQAWSEEKGHHAVHADPLAHPMDQLAAAPRLGEGDAPAFAKPRPLPESVIDGASALLSAQAGDQVAAAFDDLAEAIREGQMRSMEEMTREMLRPMLREWLDDNLPHMVERLVREEIERIARAPRR